MSDLSVTALHRLLAKLWQRDGTLIETNSEVFYAQHRSLDDVLDVVHTLLVRIRRLGVCHYRNVEEDQYRGWYHIWIDERGRISDAVVDQVNGVMYRRAYRVFNVPRYPIRVEEVPVQSTHTPTEGEPLKLPRLAKACVPLK